MLDTSLIYQDLFVVDTSFIPLDLSRFCSQYLLDTFSIYQTIFFCIYLKFDPILLILKSLSLSLSLSLFLFPLDPNHFLSPKTFPYSRFWPNPSLNPLISVLNLFPFSFFMHLTWGFKFLGIFWVFELFVNFLGWVLIICSHMLMHCIL